mmetsp:Transcript_11052/g.18054  ORF Transcript_11052/g.18054 Transcript_11052/m.18054 type:complete len:356 (-) Transcript_11052:129-1196(-)
MLSSSSISNSHSLFALLDRTAFFFNVPALALVEPLPPLFFILPFDDFAFLDSTFATRLFSSIDNSSTVLLTISSTSTSLCLLLLLFPLFFSLAELVVSLTVVFLIASANSWFLMRARSASSKNILALSSTSFVSLLCPSDGRLSFDDCAFISSSLFVLDSWSSLESVPGLHCGFMKSQPAPNTSGSLTGFSLSVMDEAVEDVEEDCSTGILDILYTFPSSGRLLSSESMESQPVLGGGGGRLSSSLSRGLSLSITLKSNSFAWAFSGSTTRSCLRDNMASLFMSTATKAWLCRNKALTLLGSICNTCRESSTTSLYFLVLRNNAIKLFRQATLISIFEGSGVLVSSLSILIRTEK